MLRHTATPTGTSQVRHFLHQPQFIANPHDTYQVVSAAVCSKRLPGACASAGQIFYDVFYARYGSGTGGIIAMGIPLIGNFCAGANSVASNSR